MPTRYASASRSCAANRREWRKSSERLVAAYQEGLVTLPQLRQRMPALQKQTQAVEAELQSLKMAAVDEAKYLQLAESLAGFRSKLRVRAEVLDIAVRQQILRLLVKDVLVGVDTITLRHSIPIPQSGPGSNGSGSQVPPSGVTGSRPNPGYLLRSGSHVSDICGYHGAISARHNLLRAAAD
jgi:site-specific DNA recombinase